MIKVFTQLVRDVGLSTIQFKVSKNCTDVKEYKYTMVIFMSGRHNALWHKEFSAYHAISNHYSFGKLTSPQAHLLNQRYHLHLKSIAHGLPNKTCTCYFKMPHVDPTASKQLRNLPSRHIVTPSQPVQQSAHGRRYRNSTPAILAPHLDEPLDKE